MNSCDWKTINIHEREILAESVQSATDSGSIPVASSPMFNVYQKSFLSTVILFKRGNFGFCRREKTVRGRIDKVNNFVRTSGKIGTSGKIRKSGKIRTSGKIGRIGTMEWGLNSQSYNLNFSGQCLNSETVTVSRLLQLNNL